MISLAACDNLPLYIQTSSLLQVSQILSPLLAGDFTFGIGMLQFVFGNFPVISNSYATPLIIFESLTTSPILAPRVVSSLDGKTVKAYIEKFDITEEDERKYLYSPKKLSLDVYKTTEYWSILLYINECHSIIDFAPTGSVNAIRPDILTKLLNEILILEGLV